MIAASGNRNYRRLCNNWRIFLLHGPCKFVVVILLGLQAALLAWSAWIHSPTHLELFHLPAGVSHLRLHRFDLYRVNPPLVRMVAALAVEQAGFHADWQSYTTAPDERAEYGVGLDCMYANDARVFWLTTLSRWACIPFIILGGWICFLWAEHLYGPISGVIALLLWCFCPYVLGHGSVITPDAHAAGMGIAASFLFWRWLKKPTWKRTLFAGIVLGLAELTKFSLLILYPLWLILWPIYRYSNCDNRSRKQILHDSGMILAMMTLSLLTINVGYEFEDSFRALGAYRFQSSLLTGARLHNGDHGESGNRFSNSWLARLPVPLPANYVQGIDTQRKDFETGILSYLRGRWQVGGWWYFYLYALGIKLPLGTWLLILLAVTVSFVGGNSRADWRDEILLIIPIIAMLILFSSQSGIGVHSRYAIPLLPFVFIWTSKVARGFGMRPFSRKRSALAVVVVMALTWSIASSLRVYPHSLAYFNEIIGGSENGFRHLAKSDCSWGQDLLLLKRWINENPEAKSVQIAHCGPLDPRLAGVEVTLPPVGPRDANHTKTIPIAKLGPRPGWYAIDVCFLLGGDPLSAANGRGGWDEPSKTPGYDLSYFLRFEPVASAGYSIFIYHITLDEANRVRRELGLSKLPGESIQGVDTDTMKEPGVSKKSTLGNG